jgi:myosin-1
MRYIASITSKSQQAELARIKDQLLDSNPILEAFGNAKTLRNENSSRFGKYMLLQFNYGGIPVGGRITTYLLEKSRVVSRAKGERAFHVFYQLLAGASDQLLGELHLQRDPARYAYLARSECYKADGTDDKADFKVVSAAMKQLNFSSALQTTVWRTIAAILHLGQLKQLEKLGPGGRVQFESDEPLQHAAKLLGIAVETLSNALVVRRVDAGVTAGKKGEAVTTPLKPAEAEYARDALTKALYAGLFQKVVEVINVTIKFNKETLDLGLLDIYGFEVFPNNSFEQLTINWTNEKLQQVFIELTLRSEQEEYVREGIEWTPVEYFDNKTICDLIESTKPPGVISLLDEACLLAHCTDSDFLTKLQQQVGKHAHFDAGGGGGKQKDGSVPPGAFRIQHYAGPVVYNVDGFVSKNSDTLYRDLARAVNSSSDETVAALIAPPPVDSKQRPPTIGTQFRRAVNGLVQDLMKCYPSYIRCIKPNDEKKSNLMDEKRTRHQIAYLGLLENVRVRRAGFANRQTYDRFFRRYKVTGGKATYPTWRESDRAGVEKLLAVHKIPESEYRLGKTKVFIKSPETLFKFEDARTKQLPAAVTMMQKIVRGHLARLMYAKVKAAVRIQTTYRAYTARSKWNTRKNIIRLQLAWRRLLARRWLAALRQKCDGKLLRDGNYGADVGWPKAPAGLAPGTAQVKLIWRTWRAHMLLKPLNDTQRAELRQRVLGYTLLHGRHAWRPDGAWRGDWIGGIAARAPKWNVAKAQRLFNTGDSELLFACDVVKVHHGSGTAARVLALTNSHIVKLDAKSFKPHKVPVPLTAVTGIGLGPGACTLVVIFCASPERDIVVDLCGGTPPYATPPPDLVYEFVSRLTARLEAVRNQPFTVDVGVRLDYNNSRTAQKPHLPPSSVSFVVDNALALAPNKPASAIVFRKGKSNTNTVSVLPNTALPHLVVAEDAAVTAQALADDRSAHWQRKLNPTPAAGAASTSGTGTTKRKAKEKIDGGSSKQHKHGSSKRSGDGQGTSKRSGGSSKRKDKEKVDDHDG